MIRDYCLPKIYYLMDGEKGGLCFNNLNTYSKIKSCTLMPIKKTDVCFKFLRLVFFNYNKNLKLFDSKSLFYS